MSERDWTREPWRIFGWPRGVAIMPADSKKEIVHWSGFDQSHFMSMRTRKANAKRIVACVNALAAVGNPEGLPELLRQLLAEPSDTDLPYWAAGVAELVKALQIDEEKLP